MLFSYVLPRKLWNAIRNYKELEAFAWIAFIFVSSTAVRIYDFHIFTVIYSPVGGFICNQNNDQLPVGLLTQLVERCTGIAEVMGSNPVWARQFKDCSG